MSILNLNDSNALLLFRVGPILVCSPTMPVEAVVLPPKITAPPGSSIAEPGVFKSIHGMVRIVDLRVRFGVDEDDYSDPGRIVIVEVEGGHAGFWVDEIEDVISFPGSGWAQVPAYIPRNVFSKTLIQKNNIRLYADFEQLDKFKTTGYLRKHIALIKAAEKKLAEDSARKNSAGKTFKSNNKSDIHEQSLLQAKKTVVDSDLKSTENNDATETRKSNDDGHIKQNSNRSDKNKSSHVTTVEKDASLNSVNLSGANKTAYPSQLSNNVTSNTSNNTSSTTSGGKINGDVITENNVGGNSLSHGNGASDRDFEIQSTKKTSSNNAALNSAKYVKKNKRPEQATTKKEPEQPVDFTYVKNRQKNRIKPEYLTNERTDKVKTTVDKSNLYKEDSGLFIKAGAAVVFMALIYFLVVLIDDSETKHVYKKAVKNDVVESVDEILITDSIVKDVAEVALEIKTKAEVETEIETEVETEIEEIVSVSESVIPDHDVKQPGGQAVPSKLEQRIFLREEGGVDISKSDDGVLIVINDVGLSEEVYSSENSDVEVDSSNEAPLATSDEDGVITHQAVSESGNSAVIEGGEVRVQKTVSAEKNTNVVELDDENSQPEEVIADTIEQKNINDVSIQVSENRTPDIKNITNKVVVSKDIKVKDQSNNGGETKAIKAENTLNKDPENKVTKSVPAKSARRASKKYIHMVVKGDTLWHIAKRYVNNPWKYPELARLSKIKNPDLIYPGDRVTIIINYRR